MNSEIIGWGASVVLLLTIVSQLVKQWSARSSEGVSYLLFAGQIGASAGFVVYSALVGNVVFIVTNALMLASAVIGLVLTWRFRRAEQADDDAPRRSRRSRRHGSRGGRWNPISAAVRRPPHAAGSAARRPWPRWPGRR